MHMFWFANLFGLANQGPYSLTVLKNSHCPFFFFQDFVNLNET